jgi:hypothetical protein
VRPNGGSAQGRRFFVNADAHSCQIEQDADAVLFLLRDEYYLQQSEPQNDAGRHGQWEADLERCRGTVRPDR